MAIVPIAIRYLAEKDASVDRIANEVKASLASAGAPINFGNPSADSLANIAQLDAQLKQVRADAAAAQVEMGRLGKVNDDSVAALLDELSKVKAEAEAARAELDRLGKSAPGQAPPVGPQAPPPQPFPTPQTPEAVAASAQLVQLRTNLDAALKVANGPAQGAAIKSVVTSIAQWKLENDTLLRQTPQLREELRSLSSAADAVALSNRTAAESSARLAQVGQQIGVAMAATGAALLGVVGYTASVAAEFQSLEAKLVTVTGSVTRAAKAFEFAKRFSENTPFEVKSLVAATVTLEAFGQRSEDILPKVAALAAGMGHSVEETSLAVAKALSGAQGGFKTLRNEFGVTTAELVKNGASATGLGGVYLKTEEQIDAAGKALLKIIGLKYGDALARQSATLLGSLSNLKDASTNLAASFGAGLVPVLTSGAKALTGFISLVDTGLPSGVKTLLIFGAAAVGTFAAAGGAALLAVSGLVVLNTSLQAAAATAAATAAAVQADAVATGAVVSTTAATTAAVVARAAATTEGALAAAGAATGRFSALLTALGTTPVGIVVLGLTAIATALYAMSSAYEEAQKKIAIALVDESRGHAKTNNDLRDNIALFEKVGKSQGVKFEVSSEAGRQIESINEQLTKLNPEQIAEAYNRTGYSLEDLKKQYVDTGKKAEESQAKIDAFNKAIEAAKGLDGDFADRAKASQAIKSAFTGANITLTDDQLGKLNDRNSAEELLNRLLREQSANLQSIQGNSNFLDAGIKATEAFIVPIDKLLEKSKQLRDFLKFSEELNTVQSLTGAIDKLKEHAHENAAELEKNGHKAYNRQDLTNLLAAPDDGKGSVSAHTKKLAADQLETLIHIDKEDEKLSKNKTDRLKEEANERSRLFRLRKAQQDVSLQEELAFTRSELALAKADSEERITLLEKQRDLKDKIGEQQTKNASAALKAQFEAAKRVVDDVKAQPGVTASTVIKAVNQMIASLKGYASAYRLPLAQSEKLREELSKLQQAANLDKLKEQAKIPAENLAVLKEAITGFSNEAIGASQKLLAIERSISLVKHASAQGSITSKEAEKELLELGKQRAVVEKQITAEKLQQAGELRNLEQQNLDQEIKILEERLANGESVEAKLKEARESRLASSLNAIQAERDAEVKLHDDAGFADQKAALKRQGLLLAETDRVYQESNKQTQAVSRHYDAIDARAAKSNGILGGGSPSFGFSLENFGDNFGVSSLHTAPKRSSFLDIQRRLNGPSGRGNAGGLAHGHTTSALRALSLVHSDRPDNAPDNYFGQSLKGQLSETRIQAIERHKKEANAQQSRAQTDAKKRKEHVQDSKTLKSLQPTTVQQTTNNHNTIVNNGNSKTINDPEAERFVLSLVNKYYGKKNLRQGNQQSGHAGTY